jgi:ATP-binding cassette, subfamily B, bacterial
VLRSLVLRQPELLIFDDISSALDLETEKKLHQRLMEIQNLPNSDWQPTILLVSHSSLWHSSDREWSDTKLLIDCNLFSTMGV